MQTVGVSLFCLHDCVSFLSEQLAKSCDQFQVGRGCHIIMAAELGKETAVKTRK